LHAVLSYPYMQLSVVNKFHNTIVTTVLKFNSIVHLNEVS